MSTFQQHYHVESYVSSFNTNKIVYRYIYPVTNSSTASTLSDSIRRGALSGSNYRLWKEFTSMLTPEQIYELLNKMLIQY
jgi:flagellar basal body rod protein FlgG